VFTFEWEECVIFQLADREQSTRECTDPKLQSGFPTPRW
jgi:hypothetical protein